MNRTRRTDDGTYPNVEEELAKVDERAAASKKRICVKCREPAENPMLPLCMNCDLTRLKRGETAADIKREAKEKGLDL